MSEKNPAHLDVILITQKNFSEAVKVMEQMNTLANQKIKDKDPRPSFDTLGLNISHSASFHDGSEKKRYTTSFDATDNFNDATKFSLFIKVLKQAKNAIPSYDRDSDTLKYFISDNSFD